MRMMKLVLMMKLKTRLMLMTLMPRVMLMTMPMSMTIGWPLAAERTARARNSH